MRTYLDDATADRQTISFPNLLLEIHHLGIGLLHSLLLLAGLHSLLFILLPQAQPLKLLSISFSASFTMNGNDHCTCQALLCCDVCRMPAHSSCPGPDAAVGMRAHTMSAHLHHVVQVAQGSDLERGGGATGEHIAHDPPCGVRQHDCRPGNGQAAHGVQRSTLHRCACTCADRIKWQGLR